jgi:hypothetical protein
MINNKILQNGRNKLKVSFNKKTNKENNFKLEIRLIKNIKIIYDFKNNKMAFSNLDRISYKKDRVEEIHYLQEMIYC